MKYVLLGVVRIAVWGLRLLCLLLPPGMMGAVGGAIWRRNGEASPVLRGALAVVGGTVLGVLAYVPVAATIQMAVATP